VDTSMFSTRRAASYVRLSHVSGPSFPGEPVGGIRDPQGGVAIGNGCPMRSPAPETRRPQTRIPRSTSPQGIRGLKASATIEELESETRKSTSTSRPVPEEHQSLRRDFPEVSRTGGYRRLVPDFGLGEDATLSLQ